jgi:hypothetical protein
MYCWNFLHKDDKFLLCSSYMPILWVYLSMYSCTKILVKQTFFFRCLYNTSYLVTSWCSYFMTMSEGESDCWQNILFSDDCYRRQLRKYHTLLVVYVCEFYFNKKTKNSRVWTSCQHFSDAFLACYSAFKTAELDFPELTSGIENMSRDNSVGTVTRHLLDVRDSISVKVTEFSLRQHVRAGSRANPPP